MGKFDELAKEVGSSKLAGWITQHNPKVRARANKTRSEKKEALLRVMKKNQ